MFLDVDAASPAISIVLSQYAILLFLIIFVGITSWKFSQLRYHSIIRCRSLPLTMFITFSGLLASIFILGTAPFISQVPCWYLFWVGYFVFPLYPVSVCAMVVRLAGEYYVGRAAIAVMDRRLRKSTYTTVPMPSDNRVDATTSAPVSPVSPASNEALLFPFRPNSQAATATDNWLLSHRYLFSVRYIFYGIIGYLIFAIITGTISYISFNGKKMPSMPEYKRCSNISWCIFLTSCFASAIVLILLPCLLFSLRKVNDAYGIRRSLVIVSASLAFGMVTYFILEYVIQVKSRAGFNVAHMIVLCVLFNHLVFICWPLYLLRNTSVRSHKRQPGDFGKFFGDNSGIEYDYPETKISLQYDAGLISRDVFRQLLNDPDRVDSFKKYTVRDLSVENILFYEACQAILTTVSSPRDGPAHSTEHSTLQRRVAMLHSTFLETDSDLEVNLTEATLHRLSSYLDSSASYGDFKAYCALMDAVRAAQEEILELMFFDTYPRYLNSASRHSEHIALNSYHAKHSTDTQEFTLAVQALTQSESQTSTFYLLDRYK